ncbi:MAG: hypothetical protein WCP12_14490 [bacterium]
MPSLWQAHRAADRTLVHHVGRWGHGKVEESKYRSCAIQNSRFTLVNNKELYWKQFGGSPDAALLNRMNPEKAEGGDDAKVPRKRKAKAVK